MSGNQKEYYCKTCGNSYKGNHMMTDDICEFCADSTEEKKQRRKEELRDLYETGHPVSDNYVIE